MRRLAIAAAILAGQACGPMQVCDPVLFWGVGVEVRDSATGGKIEAAPTGIAIEHGEQLTTVMETRVQNDHHLVQGAPRAGTYDVVITASGYRPWGRRVEVEARHGSKCGTPAERTQLNAQMAWVGT